MAEVHSFVVQERLRSIAIEADASGRDTAELAGLWQQLIEGSLSIVEHFSTRERHFLMLRRAVAGTERRTLTPRQLELLQRLLLGQPQKGAAIDCHLSASTVAGTLTETLRALGLNVSASRAPVLLSLILHAHRGQAPIRCARASEVCVEGSTLLVISTERLEEAICGKLSPAERAVVRLRTDGKSHAEIASLRKTSRRTIANQLASASRKLGVSGRCELLSYLSRAAQVATSYPAWRVAYDAAAAS